MAANEIEAYIEKCRNLGFSDVHIKEALVKVKWPEEAIQNAFLRLNNPKEARFVPLEKKPGTIFISPNTAAQQKRYFLLLTVLLIALVLNLAVGAYSGWYYYTYEYGAIETP